MESGVLFIAYGLGILDRHTSLADRCLPGLPEGNPLWTPLNKLG